MSTTTFGILCKGERWYFLLLLQQLPCFVYELTQQLLARFDRTPFIQLRSL